MQLTPLVLAALMAVVVANTATSSTAPWARGLLIAPPALMILVYGACAGYFVGVSVKEGNRGLAALCRLSQDAVGRLVAVLLLTFPALIYAAFEHGIWDGSTHHSLWLKVPAELSLLSILAVSYTIAVLLWHELGGEGEGGGGDSGPGDGPDAGPRDPGWWPEFERQLSDYTTRERPRESVGV